MMNPISIPPIAMATLVFYVGFYHFLIYRQQKENRENLTFALTCFSVGLYAFCCAGLYNVSSPEVGVEWQRLQGFVLAILGIFLLWFINDYTGHTNKKIVIGFTAYYIFAALTGLIIRSDLTWSSVASIKEVWLPFGYNIRYNEMAPGPLINFQSIVGLIYFIYIITVGIKFYISGSKKKGLPLLIALAILFVGLINDIFISSDFYDFIYVLEYSYIGMILVFTFFLTTKVIKAGEIKVALLQSEEKYRSLANNLNVGIYRNSVGSKGRFIEANPAIVKMFGFDNREEFLGVSVSDLYKNPEDRTAYNNELLRESEIKNKELQLQKKDGTVMIGSISAVAVKDEKNNLQYFDGVIEDITESKKAANEINKQKRLFETMFNTIPDGVVITNTERVIKLANKGMKSTFGYEPEELLGKSTKILYADQDKYEKTGEIIFTGKAKKLEDLYVTRYKDMSGREFSGETFGAKLLNENKQWIGNLGIMRDITERVQAEMRIQQSQRMESIGTLAGGIAHDFNNILFPILGHTEMLLEDIPEDSPFQDSLKAIHTSALRAKDLVKQILTFSRQDSSELNLIKIQPIVKEALKLIRSTIPTTIEIKQDISPACGVIKADPTQIYQIVMNLATNAYHAMEEIGGELKVGLKQIELGTLDLINPDMTPGQYACLTVVDTGMGMDKKLTQKIFDPFFTTKTIGKGTGMGLSVVHGIVTSMNGAIHVYSEPGKGTVFNVYLPVEKSFSTEPITNSNVKFQTGTEQILLVDDEEAILSLEKQILERLGYQVTSRISSTEALEAFRAAPDKFDLVITDMAMPNMPGNKLSVELIKIRPDIPVLLCTGFSETMSEKKAASLGIKGFLLKPIVMKDLAQKIRDVLDK